MARKQTHYVILVRRPTIRRPVEGAESYLLDWEEGRSYVTTTTDLGKAMQFGDQHVAERSAEAVHTALEGSATVTAYRCQYERLAEFKALKRKGWPK